MGILERMADLILVSEESGTEVLVAIAVISSDQYLAIRRRRLLLLSTDHPTDHWLEAHQFISE